MSTAPLTAADYEVVIGLEVHCQLKTNTKMFCGCKNEFGGPSNSHVCPVCLGMPGVLPVPNEEAIVKTLLTGEMLGCHIATRCKFDRKNYFYPDMPKNYQISQYDEPLCLGGAVTLDLLAYPKDAQKDSATAIDKPIRLVRIHLEEDVAKSFHFENGTSGIDFNRAEANSDLWRRQRCRHGKRPDALRCEYLYPPARTKRVRYQVRVEKSQQHQ